MATKLPTSVAITDSTLHEVAEGKFSLDLSRCEICQCGVEAPLVLVGAGFVDQGEDGGLTLRMFVTEKYDIREGMRKLGFVSVASGTLIPTSSYYDITATAQDGATWRAEHQSVSSSFGTGTGIRISLTYLERVNALPKRAAFEVKQWFIPFDVDLPWHVVTQSGSSWSRDRFEFADDDFAWSLQKANEGMHAQLIVKRQPLEPHATRFMQAMEILVGRSLRPLVTSTYSGNERVMRVHPRRKLDRSSLGTPVELGRFEPGDAHRFLSCCLHRAESLPTKDDQLLLMYRFWWRILRAHQGDIENSSLVLAVAIEGVLQALFLSEHDADTEFCRLVDGAQPAINSLDVDDRVRSAIDKSLQHAKLARPQDAMRRLVEQGVLTHSHVIAWGKLRNKGAHGAVLEDDLETFQKHLDRFHCCLDLFYRLVFTAIGYRGGFVDYSARGWGAATFPPADESVCDALAD